ncbi:MAG TPA: hypothetical protein DCL35_06065 [Candidatus Omnitrophica bacterium]|nr:hypothetical protein [Candidatus Omnitrophota bacterium]
MSEQSRQNNPEAQQHADQDVLALIKRMQQQLSFLEKKIDILIGQSQERPFKSRPYQSRPYQGKPYQDKPYQDKPYQDKPYQGKREYRDNSGERSFDRGRRFEKPREDENRGFGQKKKPFYHKSKHRG